MSITVTPPRNVIQAITAHAGGEDLIRYTAGLVGRPIVEAMLREAAVLWLTEAVKTATTDDDVEYLGGIARATVTLIAYLVCGDQS